MNPENKSVSLHDAVKLLLEADDIYLLCHQYPDGDTLGSAAALYLGLRQKGKRVSIRCGDPIPQKYDYMAPRLSWQRLCSALWVPATS